MDDQKQNPIYTHKANELKLTHDNKEPIRRGCVGASMGGCFCSGACQEIIGWRDKDGKVTDHTPLKTISLRDLENKEEKSHFEDIEETRTCIHREHKPPMHLSIPKGKRYIHICPGCKQRTVLEPPNITF